MYSGLFDLSEQPKYIQTLSNIVSAFSSGGFKSGVQALGSSMLSIIKAHPVITSLIAAYGTLKLIDTFLFDADEKFEDASKAVSIKNKDSICESFDLLCAI